MNLDEYTKWVENKRMISKVIALSALSATISTPTKESDNN